MFTIYFVVVEFFFKNNVFEQFSFVKAIDGLGCLVDAAYFYNQWCSGQWYMKERKVRQVTVCDKSWLINVDQYNLKDWLGTFFKIKARTRFNVYLIYIHQFHTVLLKRIENKNI